MNVFPALGGEFKELPLDGNGILNHLRLCWEENLCNSIHIASLLCFSGFLNLDWSKASAQTSAVVKCSLHSFAKVSTVCKA